MTPEQLAMVRDTAAMVEQAGDGFARRFYDRMFDLHPAARDLFPADLGAQRDKLVREVVFLASAAADLPAFLDRARGLGRRHRSYGVHAADYPAVGDALVDAVGDVVGDRWTAEAAGAWHCLYALVAEAMLEGAGGTLFTPGPTVHCRPGLAQRRLADRE